MDYKAPFADRTVPDPLGRDIACPRCRYNLRGLTEPRCPECGLAFAVDDWVKGTLRENIPAAFDRCDLWQPHQVLFASFVHTLRAAARPRQIWRTLDVRGPVAPSLLYFLCATGWIWLIIAAISAVAVSMHEPASPAAAWRYAALTLAPRLMAGPLVGVICLAVIGMQALPGLYNPNWRQRLRIMCGWVPGIVTWGALPLAIGLIAFPDLLRELTVLAPAVAALRGMIVMMDRSSSTGTGTGQPSSHARRAGSESARPMRAGAKLLRPMLGGLAGMFSGLLLAMYIAPQTLTPPL